MKVLKGLMETTINSLLRLSPDYCFIDVLMFIFIYFSLKKNMVTVLSQFHTFL